MNAAALLLYAVLGIPFNIGWLAPPPESSPALYCHYAEIRAVPDGEWQMVEVCTVSEVKP